MSEKVTTREAIASKKGYEHVKKQEKRVCFTQQENGKNHPMVPPLNHFQGKNKNRSSLARTISESRRSFFANLTTFERRSGLKKIFPPQNHDCTCQD